MKLEGVYKDRLLATSYRSIFHETDSGELKRIGRLPTPTKGFASIPFWLKTTKYWSNVPEFLVGNIHSVNAWQLSDDEFLANVHRWMYHSDDGGSTWDLVLELPEPSGLRGILPTAITRHDNALFLGEYLSSYHEDPRVLRSTDNGRMWEIELSLPGSRHVHAVTSDPFSKKLWIATGDTDDESEIGYILDDEYRVVGTGSQRWRTVSLVFTPNAILWGMDCPYRTNEILRLPREDLNGDPRTLHSVKNPFYYSTSIETDEEQLVIFSTGATTGRDSTAPSTEPDSPSSDTVEIWMAGSGDSYTTWCRVAKFNKRRTILDTIGAANKSANAYAFLASSENRGLFLNPFNTATANGEIRRLSINSLTNQLSAARQ